MYIIDFNKNADIENWRVIDDTVMGGVSSGSFSLTPEGHGIFAGKVSLENNGGFSSVRYRTGTIAVVGHSKIAIKVKGDGKNYQLRIKDKAAHDYSYIYEVETTGDWQEIEVALADMVPTFRGRQLNQPNFEADQIEEFAILICNKKPQDFKLLIDWIGLN